MKEENESVMLQICAQVLVPQGLKIISNLCKCGNLKFL